MYIHIRKVLFILFPVLVSYFFQSCSPHRMSVDELSTSETIQNSSNYVSRSDTAAGDSSRTPSSTIDNNRTNPIKTPATVISPTPNVTAPAAEVSSEPGIYIQNNYIGAEKYKVEMSSKSLVSFESLFPMSKEKDSTGKFSLSSHELWISADSRLARSTAEVCISDSYSSCSKNSDFRKIVFSAASSQTNLAYLQVENYWQTSVMKFFGDYYLTIKVQGLQKKALIQHRAYLAMSYGSRPSGSGFYSSTQGPNHYGFICEKPATDEVGWTIYPYGSLANTSNSAYKNCYYRVLDNQQADDYYRKMYENVAPSIRITCPASGKAGVKISCGVSSWTPYSMKDSSTWKWTVDGVQALIGERLVVNSPAAGTYKVQLTGQANNGSEVKSNIVTVTITP